MQGQATIADVRSKSAKHQIFELMVDWEKFHSSRISIVHETDD